jgi:hypothetical protein
MTTCIVVCTDDSGRYAGAVLEAARRAVAERARVILYDLTAAGRLTSARPNEWAGEGEAEIYDRPLDPVAIEKLGRHEFALQVERARQAGADAYGWLPDEKGAQGLARYAAREGADLVLIPADLDDPSFERALAGVKVDRI